MQAKSPMQRMNETSDTLEIWWDSSPLVFESWKKARLKSKPLEEREEDEMILDSYYISDRPMDQLFMGVTTNPPLSGAVIKDDPGFWREWVIEQRRKDKKVSAHELWWRTYKEIVKRGAERYLGVFRQTGFKYGYISGQVDPRDYENEEEMKRQALELKSLSSNVMIKIPGTEQGVRVLKFLTSRGIATNCTLAFILPQFVAVANAVKDGLEIARRDGVDMSYWRSVITSMTGRYEELGDFDKESERVGVEITETDKRWASIAIFKKAMRYLEEGGYPSKMLICSMRPGPVVNDKEEQWHFEKLAGANAVFTCPPKYINAIDSCEDIELDPDAWKEPVPDEVIAKLNKFQYFREAYDPAGLEIPQFNTHPSTIATAEAFSKATDEMENFVAEALK
ncbi:MAG: transaldolase [Spirochaetota bacterium]|nr:MAG: transaldolase [Spirochaetota bacterium]